MRVTVKEVNMIVFCKGKITLFLKDGSPGLNFERFVLLN